jgi:hypothetical protein
MHRVKEFPSDLEDFFRSILERVDGVYKAHTNQALKLASLHVQHPDLKTNSNFLDFWFIRRHPLGLADICFFQRHTIQLVSCKDWEALRCGTRVFLSAACKDLLQLSITRMEPDQVDFLHRTVYDFLQTMKNYAAMRNPTSSFHL